ncbi:hypothetical protein GCM10028821_43130 [Hymenobacter jeollabukensis]
MLDAVGQVVAGAAEHFGLLAQGKRGEDGEFHDNTGDNCAAGRGKIREELNRPQGWRPPARV